MIDNIYTCQNIGESYAKAVISAITGKPSYLRPWHQNNEQAMKVYRSLEYIIAKNHD